MNARRSDDWAALTLQKNSPARIVPQKSRREERAERKANLALAKLQGVKPTEKTVNQESGKEQSAESPKKVASIRKPRKWIPVIEIKPRLKRKRRLTLTELLVSLGVLAVLSAVAIPFYQVYAVNANLKSAARDIESDLSGLKQRAVTENAAYSIVFAPAQNHYTIQQKGSPIQVKTPAAFGNDIRILCAPFGGGTTIAFQNRGTATSGSVKLANSRGSFATISVNIAGRTNVQFNML